MGRYAIVRDGVVVDGPVVWDGATKWRPPDGTEALPVVGPCEVGWQVVDGVPVAPVPDLDAARTSALAEIRALAEARLEGDVQVPGYPPLGVGREARDGWASLLGAVTACEALGVDPDLAVFPAPFSSRDGKGITLRSKAEARGLYLMLFAAGAGLQRASDAAVVAVSQAATVDEVEAALDAYRSAK